MQFSEREKENKRVVINTHDIRPSAYPRGFKYQSLLLELSTFFPKEIFFYVSCTFCKSGIFHSGVCKVCTCCSSFFSFLTVNTSMNVSFLEPYVKLHPRSSTQLSLFDNKRIHFESVIIFFYFILCKHRYSNC